MSQGRKRMLPLIYAGYLFVGVIFLGPIAFMVWGAFQSNRNITSGDPAWFDGFTTANFVQLFEQQDFGHYLVNSIVVAGGSTVLGLLLGAPVSYVVSRYTLGAMGLVVLVVRMAPAVLFVVPLFLLATRLGTFSNAFSSYLMLILAHLIITLPLAVWFMLPFFDGIPPSLNEAATIDGCSLPQTFTRIALPMALPGLAVTSTLCFIFSWNFFLFALVLSNPDTQTLPVVAFSFIGVGESNWAGLMGASLMIASPALILALLSQRLIVRGMTAGAVR